jgi:hypothetical protein
MSHLKINPLKPSDFFIIYINLKLKRLHFAHTVHLYIQYDCHSEQSYFPIQNSPLMKVQRVQCEVAT